jgi:hypothetical protein
MNPVVDETKVRLQNALTALHEREVLAHQIRTQHGTSVAIQCISDAFMGVTDTLKCTDGFFYRNTHGVTVLDLASVFMDARVKSVIQALKEAGFALKLVFSRDQSPYCEINLKLRTFRLVHPDAEFTSTEPPSDVGVEES